MIIKRIALATIWCTLFTCVSAQVVTPAVQLPRTEKFTRIPTIKAIAIQTFLRPSTALRQNEVTFTCPCAIGCGPLPVALLSFEARRLSPERVMVQWETTNELNNKGFEVEVAYDRPEVFSPVGFVPAQAGGGNKKKYQLPDKNDFNGNSWYRLKQVDLDQNFVYSKVVLVKGFGERSSLSLYPNPVINQLTASVYSIDNTPATVLVLDGIMKVVNRLPVKLQKGVNQISIPVGALAKGTYFIKVVEQNNSMVKQFVKQ